MRDDDHDLLAAYAMDALDQDEREAFETHLDGCPRCRAELVGLREALAELAGQVSTEPPAALRGAVLDAVAASGPPAAVEPAAASGPGRIDEPPRTDGPGGPVAARSGRWPLLVAAAVAVLALIGVTVWQPWNPRPTAVTAADVLAAADAVRATGTAGGGQITLVRSNALGRAVLITRDMPSAPAGMVHQAWLQHPGGAMTSAGVMAPDADQTMLLEGDARGVTGAGISVEPAGGSAHPGDVIALILL